MNWLKRLWDRIFRRDSLEIYRPWERAIYQFWNGSKSIKADPITLYKKVMAHGPELSADIQVSQSPLKDAASCHDALVKQIRNIFGLKGFEEGGLSELETIELLDHFLVYCNSLKKNWNQSVNLPTKSDGNVSANGVPPIKNMSASGSTAEGSSTEMPGPLPSELASP